MSGRGGSNSNELSSHQNRFVPFLRLDYLTEKLLAHDAGRIGDDPSAVEAEKVMDFLGAFERLLGPELLNVN